MKLSDHVEHIRQLIDTAFRNRLGRMGITTNTLQPISAIPAEYHTDRKRIEPIRETLIAETGTVAAGYEKMVEEFTFTFFNRLAALKVMEAHTLHPEIITRRSQHGDRSFAHKHWLEEHTAGRNEEMEGLVSFIGDELSKLATDIPLFSPQHPYHLLPTAIEINSIINAFNKVEIDEQVESEIWNSDDVLGWLYESYNNYKKAAHKDSGAKTEYNKVSIQSQVYTPRWVVKFLVDNSLGKMYLEMYPNSDIRNRYKIANAPNTQAREPKRLTEIRLIDPATGSGNFLLYAFDLFYDLYKDQIENYGGDYDEKKISELIITHNLHGVDLDDRAVQIAQLGLYIKAKRKKRSAKIDHFNIVSSDFFLPDYAVVKDVFEEEGNLDERQKKVIRELWTDLQQAYKFGALIRIEEKLSLHTHALVQQFEKSLFSVISKETLDEVQKFKASFFTNLHKAIALSTAKQGQTFLNTKTQDAITYLQVLTQKYDIAVANPPYTDGGDFGPELKKFVEVNYKKPYKFNTNLYATFIKRCCELTEEDAYVALIHPNTFMFIKTFEDVRRFLIDKLHIDLLVDYGLDRVNLFGGDILLDSTCWYIFSKTKKNENGIYLNIATNQQEKQKRLSFFQAIDDVISGTKNQRIFFLDQAKFSVISSSPFIYWISDEFRGQFANSALEKVANIVSGVKTGNNEGALRLWWEVKRNDVFDGENYVKWVQYTKGGEFRKWQGNNWLCVNWENDCQYIKSQNSYNLPSKEFSFVPGITYSGSGQKGICFRYLETNVLYDMGSSSVFPKDNLLYTLAVLNSKLVFYIVNCLNPTVNKQPNDVKRIPLPAPTKEAVSILGALCEKNIGIRKRLENYSLLEFDYKCSPLLFSNNSDIKNRLKTYFNDENYLLTVILLNEAIINEKVFDVYDLPAVDKAMVLEQEGASIGALPIDPLAKQNYLANKIDGFPLGITEEHIKKLPEKEFTVVQREFIENEFPQLYKKNNDLEEFCIRHQVNPINVWHWFRESKALPVARAAEIGLEFLADAFRTILMEDEDGIVPLVGLPGEPRLIDRLEQYCFKEGFTTAQFMQLDSIIGRPLNEYIEQHFFRNFSDHLNLFMYLPKTPFIWHLTSGDNQGFEAYIIIYKWNSDSLYRLKSSYLSKRVESLNYRLQQIGDSNTAQAQTEKETIRRQLHEIDDFSGKIDELIAEGYNPKLDDGVGKNIAPLQKKGMLKAEVLNKKQLDKYLNADW